MPTSNPKNLNCPTCGAPLELDGSKAVIRCNFCQNVILIDALKPGEKPETAPEKSRGIPEEILEQLRNGNLIDATRLYREIYDVSHTRARYAIEQIQSGNLISPEAGFPLSPEPIIHVSKEQKTGIAALFGGLSLVGCGLPILITFIVGGVFLFIMLIPGTSSFNPKLNPYHPSVLLPAEKDGHQDVVTQFFNVNDGNRLLGRISTLTGKLIWKSEALPKDKSVDLLRNDEKNLYYVNDQHLVALNNQDGTQTWQVAMPDQLEYGEDSLVIAGERIIAITKDRSMQAYDISTGKQVWIRKLSGYDRRIRKIGNWIAILDYVDNRNFYNLIFLDPSDGHETLILSPVCRAENSFEDDLDTDSGIIYDESENSIYVVFGFFDGCVQRYNLSNGQLAWEYTQDDAFNFHVGDFQSIQTDAQIIFSFEHNLYLINKQSGILQSKIEDPDYELIPMILNNNNLVVRARRTLGSERFELWGINTTNGIRNWQVILENSKPLDPPNETLGLLDVDDFAWTWQVTPTEFLLLNFQADPNQLVIKPINIGSGKSNSDRIIPFKKISSDYYSSPDIIGWQENLIYFTLETKLYVVNVNSGEIVLQY